ncbi:type II toxin-antitoxin system VapB family antitoxin [Caenimonas sp. SL110]|uniref:type II toxin-antitoxin system VapB family antitoxin n=1 Tax=Caenimonas sp. SL110 TaxID=1450524 RepID=UPI0006537132|nr:type II toxin-antitoxin system VapB family antitoxin [Caenimonas sp. SL110]
MSTRTNIVLDDDLVEQAMVLAGVTTKKAAVEAALKAYVRKPDYSGLLALEGSDVLAADYDPKALFTHPRYGAPQAGSQGAMHVAEPVPVYAKPAAPARVKKPARK